MTTEPISPSSSDRASNAGPHAGCANRAVTAIALGFGIPELDFPALAAWFILAAGLASLITAARF